MHRLLHAKITRPDNTTQYSIGDVIGGLLTFNSDMPTSRTESAVLTDSAAPATKIAADLFLFSRPPTVAADNAAFAPTDAEVAECFAVLPFAAADFHTLGTAGITHINPLLHPIEYVSVPAKFYGVLVATNTYTPVALEEFNIKLGLES